MAMNYFYRVFLADVDGQGNVGDRQISFDSSLIVAGEGPSADDHDIKLEQDGKNTLVKITTFKQFAAALIAPKIHTIHTLLLLEQEKTAVATDIELFKWDDKVRRDKEGNPSLTNLANVVASSKVTWHKVATSEDGYWFHFDIVGGAEFDDHPATRRK